MKKVDKIIHKWLKVPYRLNIHIVQRVKKPRATLLFIHGIGNSTAAWDKVINRMPADVSIVNVDLLGFGFSPRPTWAVYDARRQARSVAASYRRLRLRGPVIIVGHSLGALVAVEMAKLYPRTIKSLVLCSPPFYTNQAVTKKLLPNNEKILLGLYRAIQTHPEQFVKISAISAKYGIINRAFQVTDENVHAYMGALEASIVNQTAYEDVQKIPQSVAIIYGTLDPVVVAKNIKQLALTCPNITAKSTVAAHEIKGPYIAAIAKLIIRTIDTDVRHT
ncbi:MAG: alpha/beta fold hydrolase [Candidatus Saccharimonadales bacterium]